MLSKIFSALAVLFLFSSLVAGAAMVDLQSAGASTPLSSKATICNVKDYGGIADGKTDIGPAISKAYSSCAWKGGATIYVPPGNYSLATAIKINMATGLAIQIDGLITLVPDGAFNGNAMLIENSNDIELFSSNGLGAISGEGYITRKGKARQNSRLIRFTTCSHVTVHDLLLVDSPTFHLVFNGVSNLHVYQMTIRGPDVGGTDGIDLQCADNCYLHHIQVTNRDECISVKSPSQNTLIEDIYCNQSGGMSIGSVTADAVPAGMECAVSNITMRNIYAYQCTQMLMIKSFPGGKGAVGYVKDSLFENFISYDSTYGLDIDQYWERHTTPNTGAVAVSGLTFRNWTGTVNNGISRGPIVIRGSDIVPITDVTLTDFDMWTVNGGRIENVCKNVYGTGYCAAKSTSPYLTTFTTTMTTTTPPAAFTSPTWPTWGVPGFGVVVPIPVYHPAAMWLPSSSDGVPTAAPAKSTAVVKPSSIVATSSVVKTSISTSTAKIATSTEAPNTFTFHSATEASFTSVPKSTTFSAHPSMSKHTRKSNYTSISVFTSRAHPSASTSTKDLEIITSITPSVSEIATPVTTTEDCVEAGTITVTVIEGFETASSTSATASLPCGNSSTASENVFDAPAATPVAPSAKTSAPSVVVIASSIPIIPVQASSSLEPSVSPSTASAVTLINSDSSSIGAVGYYTSAVGSDMPSSAVIFWSAPTSTNVALASAVTVTAYECPTLYSA